MYADFRHSTNGRGTSFKGALAYYLNDKGEEGEQLDTDERVDVLELRNLATEDARHAWFEMMNTAEASAALKEAAGIAKGGRKGEKPVFTYYLAWHESETPDRATMREAAQSTLEKLGLQDHQALIVSHTDTQSPHVHVIVNRVNPIDGRYANLSNCWKDLKEWAIQYEKERGTSWHIPLEQAKAACQQERQVKRSDRQTAFGEAAGAQPRMPERAGTPSAEAAAETQLKAALSEKWKAFQELERDTAGRQKAERDRLWQDRKAQRAAIYEKFNEAYQAIWARQRPKPAAPVRTPIDDRLRRQLGRERAQFEQRERSIVGRLRNARQLAKDDSFLSVVKLAFNESERRQKFDLAQRKTAAQGSWGQGVRQEVKRDKFPETRKMQADRLKVMRTSELAAFDRETQQQRAGMNDRHSERQADLKAIRAALFKESRTAWAKHAEQFRPPATQQQEAAQEQGRVSSRDTPETRSTGPQQPQRDRFGRSRDRKPRQPRAERQERSTRDQAESRTDRQGRAAANPDRPVAASAVSVSPMEALRQAEAAHVWTAEERSNLAAAKAREAAERDTNERDPGRGYGRER